MKSYQLAAPQGLDAVQWVDTAEPELDAYGVLVDMRAWSLNYRDLAMLHGGYPRNDKVVRSPPLVPLSDGVGEVIATGDAVTRFRVGDRVAAIFFQQWLQGDLTDAQIDSALGGAIDGVLAERCAFHEDGLVGIPEQYSYAEAATLPCAAVTAWQALTLAQTGPGHTVLLLGTGGVSIFALQFAKAMGARVIMTSSSDDKLRRARDLGADVTINYRDFPEWQLEVLTATGGQGADHVIEVGGAGTLEKSCLACKVSGRISLIGVLSGEPETNPSPYLVLFKRLTMQGIYVGSRDMFEQMNKAIATYNIKPVIDRTFSFDEVRQAYEYLHSGQHFGKVVVIR